MTGWTAAQLDDMDRARELEVRVPYADGRDGDWTPIWVVTTGHKVLVRTWRRRDTGWYGRAIRAGAASIRVPGTSAEVTVAVVGTDDRTAVDAAFVAKYGAAGAGSMVTDEAAASTLRLTPEPQGGSAGP